MLYLLLKRSENQKMYRTYKFYLPIIFVTFALSKAPLSLLVLGNSRKVANADCVCQTSSSGPHISHPASIEFAPLWPKVLIMFMGDSICNTSMHVKEQLPPSVSWSQFVLLLCKYFCSILQAWKHITYCIFTKCASTHRTLQPLTRRNNTCKVKN